MKKLFLLAITLMLLSGCVSFPEEEPQQKPEELLIPAEPKLEPAPVVNATEPNPLAPLPKANTSNIAPRPKAITVNATNTTAPANTPKTVQKGWTTESLSIEEGETKYVYIKQ